MMKAARLLGAMTSTLEEMMGHWEGMRPMRRMMRADLMKAREVRRLKRQLAAELGAGDYDAAWREGYGYGGGKLDGDEDWPFV